MHIVFNRLACAFFGCLEQGAHVHIKAQIGIGGGHHFGATVVTVLAQLGDHHAGATAFFVGEVGNFFFELFPALGRVISSSVHTGHLLRVGAMAPINFFKRIAHLTHGGTQANGFDRQVEQVALAAFSRSSECIQRSLHFGTVA